MVAVGARALPKRRYSHVAANFMNDDQKHNKLDRKMKAPRRKGGSINQSGYGGNKFKKPSSKSPTEHHNVDNSSSKHHNWSEPRLSNIRKPVDPETSQYFSEISNTLGSDMLELEERSVICCNALEEACGKELELATDYILSHTLETLLEGADVDHLCGFLRDSADVFPIIAMDRSGSHVAEAALKSLVSHLEDEKACNIIEDTLDSICKVVASNPIEIMCNRYGSHVLRSLLCLLGGVALDSPEFHGMKRHSPLTENAHFGIPSSDKSAGRSIQFRFPMLLKCLVSEIMKFIKDSIRILQVDPYGGLVLQTALKLLEGHDEDLLNIIPIIFGSANKFSEEGCFIQKSSAKHLVELMKQTSFSHLVEAVLGVSPEGLFSDLLTKVFKRCLLELSLDQCGNFVVQALISRVKSEKQMEVIWQQIGTKFRDLLENGKSGVVASLLAASERLEIYQHECVQSVAAAVCSVDDDARTLAPRILFLDSFFSCNDRSSWFWPANAKVHVMGSLILQSVFRFKSDIINNFVSSIASMEADQTAEVAMDSRGARVIEAFLAANIPTKVKRRLIMKLRGRFGELALRSAGSFAVEKCFAASNLSLREAMASELLEVRSQLSKTKQGPYLLRKMDIECFANKRDDWRSKQSSRQSAYKDFYDSFGSNDRKLKAMRRSEGDDTVYEGLVTGKAFNGKEKKPFLSVDAKKRSRKGAADRPRKKMRS